MKLQLKSLVKSKQLLYLIFIIVLLNLGYFITNKDNEALFLFIVISYLVYSFTKNMIYVLFIPFAVVNMLILLKYLLNHKTHMNMEGFDLMDDASNLKFDEKLFIMKWIQDNTLTGSMTDYQIYKDKVDESSDVPSLKNIIEEIQNEEIQGDKTNVETIDTLLQYVEIISTFSDDNDNTNKDEVEFVKSMMTKISDDFNEKENFTKQIKDKKNNKENIGEKNKEKNKKIDDKQLKQIMNIVKKEIRK